MNRPPVRYFRLNFGAMTVGEIWRGCEGNLVKFIAISTNKIGLKLVIPTYTASLKTEWIPIDPDDIPRAAMKQICNQVSPLKDVGFELISYGETPLLEETREMFTALMLSKDGVTGVGVVYLREPHKTTSAATMATRCSDGSYIVTTSEMRLFNMPSNRDFRYFQGMPASRLHDQHQERLHQAESRGKNFLKFTKQNVAEDSLRFVIEFGEYLVDRGVLVEIPDEEVEEIFWRRGDDHDD